MFKLCKSCLTVCWETVVWIVPGEDEMSSVALRLLGSVRMLVPCAGGSPVSTPVKGPQEDVLNFAFDCQMGLVRNLAPVVFSPTVSFCAQV